MFDRVKFSIRYDGAVQNADIKNLITNSAKIVGVKKDNIIFLVSATKAEQVFIVININPRITECFKTATEVTVSNGAITGTRRLLQGNLDKDVALRLVEYILAETACRSIAKGRVNRGYNLADTDDFDFDVDIVDLLLYAIITDFVGIEDSGYEVEEDFSEDAIQAQEEDASERAAAATEDLVQEAAEEAQAEIEQVESDEVAAEALQVQADEALDAIKEDAAEKAVEAAEAKAAIAEETSSYSSSDSSHDSGSSDSGGSDD